MALPTDRASFKKYCLRKLGAPVINLELDEDQIDDRVDEALVLFQDYHFEGTEKTYYKYQFTPDDINNQYITLPENIIGAVDIFDIGQSLNTNNLFNIRYQIALNDLYTLTSVSMVPYYMALQHIQFLEIMLVGKQPIRYTRSTNKFHIDMAWDLVAPGDYVIVKAYQVVDPNVYIRMWSDKWLMRYGTCLLKQQWAENLQKYKGMVMPGGVQFNVDQIMEQALKEKQELENELVHSWSLPAYDMIG